MPLGPGREIVGGFDNTKTLKYHNAKATGRAAFVVDEFVLVALSTWSMGYAQAKQVMDALGPSYVAVRPDRFMGFIKGTPG